MTALPALAQLPVRSTDLLADNSERVLPISEAFPWFVSEAGPGQFRITFHPAAEHYLYAHAFGFSLRSGDGELSLAFELPPGIEKSDQFFGDVIAYYDEVTVALELDETASANAELLIEYQGCADWGFCYPPPTNPLRPALPTLIETTGFLLNFWENAPKSGQMTRFRVETE